MFPSWLQIAIVVVLLILLFGKGKISSLMGDLATGIKSFKKGMADDDTVENKPDPAIETKAEAAAEKDTATKT